LYFAHRTVARLLCRTYSHSHARPFSPSLAYLDLSGITQQRRAKIEGPSAALSAHPLNPPRFRRAQKLLRRYTPADLFKNPYLFALLVAIAQTQQRRLYNKNSNEDTSVSNAITPHPPSPPSPLSSATNDTASDLPGRHHMAAYLNQQHPGHVVGSIRQPVTPSTHRRATVTILAASDRPLLSFASARLLQHLIVALAKVSKLSMGCLRYPSYSAACCVVASSSPRTFCWNHGQ
jgi:hypothetical protein